MSKLSGYFRSRLLRLAAIFALLGAAFVVYAQATGDAPIAAFWKHGYVYTRGLYLGPNGYPIWAEYNKNDGKLIHAIAEAVDSGDQLYGSAKVISGDAYRAEMQAYQDLNAQHPNQTQVFTRANYESLGGTTYLYPTTKSVVVWAADNGSLGSLALQSSIDLTSPDSSVNAQTTSVLIDKNGKVLKASANDIGYRSSFFIPKEGESEQIPHLGSIGANAADELRSYRKRTPEEIPLGPVAGANMQPGAFTGGAITEDSGKYFMPYFGPPCPGFFMEYSTAVTATVPFRDFNPRNRSGVGFWPTFIVASDTCNGLGFGALQTNLIGLMAQMTVRELTLAGLDLDQRLDLLINVLILSSDGVVRNPAGSSMVPTENVPRGATSYTSTPSDNALRLPQNLDINGDHVPDCVNWTDDHARINVWFKPSQCPPLLVQTEEDGPFFYAEKPDLIRAPDTQNDPNHQGLLSSLSTDDLKNTDIYVFRASTGDLLAKRKGLYDQEKQITSGTADFYYRIITRSFKIPHPGGAVTQEDLLWQTPAPQLEVPELTNPLRPGEMLQIIAINRATGYMATQTVPAKGPNTWLGYLALPKLVLAPPHLKIWAERDYELKAGFTQGQRHYLIGNEGSALQSDTMIRVYSEWTDDQGMPLPKGLEGEGFTGRLAMVAAPGQLQEASVGQVAHFPINPGRHTQLIQLSQDTSPLTHFYVQVVGDPTEQQYSFEPTGAGAGPLEFRPKHYVPFQVPLLDEMTTNTERLVNHQRPPTYYWPYRAEFQFSVFTLEQAKIHFETPSSTDGQSPVPHDIDLLNTATPKEACDIGELLRHTSLVELLYRINSPQQPVLDPFGPQRRLIFALGGEETTTALTSDAQGNWDFQNVEHLRKLEPSDFSALQLIQNSDFVNVLWEYSFPNSSCRKGLTEGNPCNAGTGAKTQLEIDYETPGNPLLRFERYYNSFAPSDARDSIGVRWSHNYYRYITALTGIDTPTIQMWRESGEILSFRKTNGAWETDPNNIGILVDRAEGGWTYFNSRNTEIYSPEGRLISESDLAGHSIQLAYHAGTGRLEAVSDDSGRVLRFVYDENGRLIEVRDPGNRPYRYIYEDINLVGVTYPDDSSRRYLYEQRDVPHALTGLIDENGRRFATWTYSRSGRVTGSEHAGGAEKVELAYNGDGSTTVVDGLGGKREYQTKVLFGQVSLSRLSGERCAFCGQKSSEIDYDEHGFVSRARDYNGNETRFKHDVQGREVQRIEASGTALQRIITTKWHSEFRLPTQVDEPGRRMVFVYDDSGNRISEAILDTSTGQSRKTTYTYTAFNRVETIDGPRTDVKDVTKFGYDEHHNVVSISDALGHVTRIERDIYGNATRVTDPNGVESQYFYDNRQRLTRRVVAGAETRYVYDHAGSMKSVLLPTGDFIRYNYDDAHRPVEIQDSAGNRIAYVLDAMGNVLQARTFDRDNHLRRAVNQIYDELGRLKQISGNGGQIVKYEYDREGNRTVERVEQLSTLSHFDALLRLDRVTDSDGGDVTYEYDALNRIRRVTDPKGLKTTYTYNGLGDLIRQDSPDTGITEFQYDGAGNRIEATDARGLKVRYAYDALNRLTLVDYPDSVADTVYYYDNSNALPNANAIGRLSGINQLNESLRYRYSPRGQLLAEHRTRGNDVQVTSYIYDAGDRLISMVYPSGREVNYDRNAQGKIAQVRSEGQTIASGIEYLPFGPITRMVLGNGLAIEKDYDNDYRLRRQKVGDIYQTSLDYDARNLITAIHDDLDDSRSQYFDYDNLGHLSTAAGAYGQLQYSYDANGNRLQEIRNGEYRDYVYENGSNRLARIEGNQSKIFAYDAAGNVVADGSRTYSYDSSGRAVLNGSQEQKFGADGHRIGSDGAQSLEYLYDASGALISEGVAGSSRAEYVSLNGIPIALFVNHQGGDGAEVFYYLTDHQGTPQKLVDDNQQVVWDADYEPFGAVQLRTESVRNPIRFSGQYQSATQGIYQNWYRSYDAESGRYLESDPLGLQAGLSTYTYAGANPLSFNDPTGLCPFCAVWLFLTENPATIPIIIAAIADLSTGSTTPLSAPASAAASAATKTGVVVEQYALRAMESGWYPVMVRGCKEAIGLVWLEKGEIWKIGTTKNPATRYSLTKLEGVGEHGVEYVTEFEGTVDQALKLEKMKITNYVEQQGNLPPGNKIVR